MKIFSLLFMLFILPLACFLQSETMPVILVSSDSKVTHQDKSTVKVIPGSIMNKSGILTFNPNGRVIVYHNYIFAEVTGDKSPVALDRLFIDDGSLVSKSELAVGEKMSDAVYNATISGVKMKNQKTLVSGFGDKTGSGKDGWGNKTGNAAHGRHGIADQIA